MASDADFWAYVDARWPTLVRSLVERGATPAEAHERAAEALSRCRRRWAEESRHGDVDALVRDELAAVWRGTAKRVTEELTVLAPPTVQDLKDLDRRRRDGATRRAAAVLLPLALVAGGLTWWTTRDEPKPPSDVTRAENPLTIPWYADGVLHLAHVTLPVKGLLDLTEVRDGVVYGDTRGRVVHVAADGTSAVLGHKDRYTPVAADDEQGWAAWLDPTGRTLVVRTTTGHFVGELDTNPGTSVIAVDGSSVYFRDRQGAHAWLPEGTAVVPVTPAELVDVRSRIRAFQLDGATIQVVQSAFDVAHALPGRGAALAADGDTVATRLDPSGVGRLALYDTRSGEQLDSGLPTSEVALAVALGERHTVTYVVARAADMITTGPFLTDFERGDLVIRQCDLAPVRCTDRVTLTDATEVPLLAR